MASLFREQFLNNDLDLLTGGPDNSSGSSVGLGGGIGLVRSISGGSVLTMILRAVFGIIFFLPLLLMGTLFGDNTTSFGEENFTAGGSYGGIGVVLLLRTAETCFRVSEGTGRIKSALGFAACGDWSSVRLVGEADLALRGGVWGSNCCGDGNTVRVGDDCDNVEIVRPRCLICFFGFGLGV